MIFKIQILLERLLDEINKLWSCLFCSGGYSFIFCRQNDYVTCFRSCNNMWDLQGMRCIRASKYGSLALSFAFSCLSSFSRWSWLYCFYNRAQINDSLTHSTHELNPIKSDSRESNKTLNDSQWLSMPPGDSQLLPIQDLKISFVALLSMQCTLRPTEKILVLYCCPPACLVTFTAFLHIPNHSTSPRVSDWSLKSSIPILNTHNLKVFTRMSYYRCADRLHPIVFLCLAFIFRLVSFPSCRWQQQVSTTFNAEI